MKWVIVIKHYTDTECQTQSIYVANQKIANELANTYNKILDKDKVKVIDILSYTEFIKKYKKDEMEEKAITIKVYEKESGKLIHCVDGTCEPFSNGEIFTSNYTLENENIEIENAEFNIVWVSEVINKQQTILVEYIPNTGKILFPKTLNDKINDASDTILEIEKRIRLMGKEKFANELITAYNIINMYRNAK